MEKNQLEKGSCPVRYKSWEAGYKAGHTQMAARVTDWVGGGDFIFVYMEARLDFYKLLLCMVPTAPCLHAAWHQHSFPRKHTLKFPWLFRIFGFGEIMLCHLLLWESSDCLRRMWMGPLKCGVCTKGQDTSRGCSPPKTLCGESSLCLFTCTASCMRARSMSWPGAWSEPGSMTQGLGETPPQSLQTAPNDSDQRTRASPAESLRCNTNKDAEDSSCYLSDLIFLKLAWLMLFIFHCSWLIFTKFSRQHLCLFLASLKPTRLA